MMNWYPRILRSAVVSMAFSLLSLQLAAQEQKPAAAKSSSAVRAAATANASAAAPHGQELTAADLSAFLDGLVPQQIEKSRHRGRRRERRQSVF
jgi:hypothetical protein